MNTRRLRKLGNYLLNVPPERYNQRSYCSAALDEVAAAKTAYCGTSACGAGHAATLFPELLGPFVCKECWGCRQFINYTLFAVTIFDLKAGAWDFLFSSYHKDCPLAAARRIFYLCDNPKPYELTQSAADAWFAEHYEVVEE